MNISWPWGRSIKSVEDYKALFDHCVATSRPAQVEGPTMETAKEIEGEILAWRGWNLGVDRHEQPILLSFNNVEWDGPSLTADRPPSSLHSHGIYSLKERPDWADRDAGFFLRAAFGQIALTGLVVEGEKGYRSERATIRTLWVGNPRAYGPTGERLCAWEIAGLLAERYQVEAEVATEHWERRQTEFENAQYRRHHSFSVINGGF